MRTTKDLQYNERQTLDLYLPEGKGFPVVVYFHGGGFTEGDKARPNILSIAESAAMAGIGFASVNYSLYPAAKYPDFLNDAADAVAYIRSLLSSVGGEKLFIVGQSAGAYMSLMLALDPALLARVGMTGKDVSGWLIESAQPTTHFRILTERGIAPSAIRVDDAAPLYYLNEKTDFSPMKLLVYSEDMPCRPEQNALLYRAILTLDPKAPITLETLPGGHCAASVIPGADGTYPFTKILIDFIKQHQ